MLLLRLQIPSQIRPSTPYPSSVLAARLQLSFKHGILAIRRAQTDSTQSLLLPLAQTTSSCSLSSLSAAPAFAPAPVQPSCPLSKRLAIRDKKPSSSCVIPLLEPTPCPHKRKPPPNPSSTGTTASQTQPLLIHTDDHTQQLASFSIVCLRLSTRLISLLVLLGNSSRRCPRARPSSCVAFGCACSSSFVAIQRGSPSQLLLSRLLARQATNRFASSSSLLGRSSSPRTQVTPILKTQASIRTHSTSSNCTSNMFQSQRSPLEEKAWSANLLPASPSSPLTSHKTQHPKILWIGCADSRVPESVICDAKPGDIFVTVNIANQFRLDDDNALSVLTFAVQALGIEPRRCGGSHLVRWCQRCHRRCQLPP